MISWSMKGYTTKEALSDKKCYFSKFSQIWHFDKQFIETLIYFEWNVVIEVPIH
jgi:hypothetical protein